jgi:hypothetical protein
MVSATYNLTPSPSPAILIIKIILAITRIDADIMLCCSGAMPSSSIAIAAAKTEAFKVVALPLVSPIHPKTKDPIGRINVAPLMIAKNPSISCPELSFGIYALVSAAADIPKIA